MNIRLLLLNLAFSTALQKQCGTQTLKVDNCEVESDIGHKKLLNSAFLFVKPHANNEKVRDLVRTRLSEARLTITDERSIPGTEIDSKKLIDEHYRAIASRATLTPARDVPVPPEAFEESFGEKWSRVLAEDRACNALEACERFDCSPSALNDAWQEAKIAKFGGGFYCGLVSVGDEGPLYVFNAFFLAMREKYAGDVSIHCFEVEWDPEVLSWKDFRGELLGSTDPTKAAVGSIRREILDRYGELDLGSKPTTGDNGVHGSASPFEGLAERVNWLERDMEEDGFGRALLAEGLDRDVLRRWFDDPTITIAEGEEGGVFDALEDTNARDCLNEMKRLYALNTKPE